MSFNNGVATKMMWDEVHVLTVNYQRQEMFLSENGGSAPGELSIKEVHMTIRADLRDPLKVLDMAVRYAIRYELLARVLDADIVKVFEQIGVKDFLDRLVGLTTDEMRRKRFEGLSFFEFTVNKGASSALAVSLDDDDDEPEEEVEITEIPVATVPGRTRRSRAVSG